MPLDFETVTIPFGHGLAEDKPESLVPANKLAVAEQGWIRKNGSIEIRPGFQSMPVSIMFGTSLRIGISNLVDVRRLIGHGFETLASTGYILLSYSEGGQQWVEKDHAYEATVVQRRKGERGRDAINAEGDVAYCNGYYVHTWWVESTSAFVDDKVFVRFVDAKTGARLPDVAIATDRPYHRIIVAGNLVHVVYYKASASAIYAETYDTADLETSLVSPTSTNIGATAVSPGLFDACADTSATTGVTKCYLAYYYNATMIRVVRLSASLTAEAFQSYTANVSKTIAVHAVQGKHIFVAYTALSTDSPNGVCVSVLAETTLALELLPTSIDTAIYNGTATEVRAVGVVGKNDSALVVYEMRQNALLSTRAPELRARWITSTGGLGDGSKTYRVGMLSRPIIHHSEPYVVGYYHERSHTHITGHSAPGYPNRFAYLLHIQTGTASPPVDV